MIQTYLGKIPSRWVYTPEGEDSGNDGSVPNEELNALENWHFIVKLEVNTPIFS